MAKEVVAQRGITIRLACQVFTVSQSCFRYVAKTDEENKQIADWLLRLTDNNRNWGFGLCFFVPAQHQGVPVEPQARLQDLSGAGAKPAYQTTQTHSA